MGYGGFGQFNQYPGAFAGPGFGYPPPPPIGYPPTNALLGTPYTSGLGSFGPTCTPGLSSAYNLFRYSFYNNPAIALAQCTINCNATCIAYTRPSGACTATTVAPIYNACACA